MSKSHFKTELKNLSELSNHIGKEIGISEWFEITQEDIDQFDETLNENNSFICEANTRSISNKILEAIKSNSNKKIDEIRKLKKKLNWNNFTEQIIEFIK